MANKLVFDSALRQGLRDGSETLRRAVERNYGPIGRNTICEQQYDLPLSANTGRRILRDFSIKEPVGNLAAVLVREAALRVAAQFGDGSIATAVLADALISRGETLIASGCNPMPLRRGLERALSLIPALLEKITIPFDPAEIGCLAAAAAKNEEVAENVWRAFELVGPDGVVTVQDSQLRDTQLQFWDGVRYEYGLFTPRFINEPEKRRTVLTEPYVLLSNVKIDSAQDILKLLEDTAERQVALLIIASDISEEVLTLLTANASNGLKAAAVKAPGYGEERRRNMLSLAAKVGSLLFDENTGYEMKSCGLEICAKISRAEADKDSTVLQGFRDSSEEMTDMLRRHTLQQLESTTDPDEVEGLKTTLSILNGKTAQILVGAPIEYEMFEKKYLYENTIGVLRSAARSGLVPGAGNAYLFLADRLRESCVGWNEAEVAGVLSLCDALGSLPALLAENAGENSAVIRARVRETDNPFIGYDTVNNRLTDLRLSGILTPRAELEAIITAAAGTAASLWTAGAAVVRGK